MQEYLQKTRLSSWTDALGEGAAALFFSVGLFVFLWGARLPALAAGLALFCMLLCLSRAGRRRRLGRREASLRRRIGGEMALERLLLRPPEQAHFEAALLLTAPCRLEMVRLTPGGVLCRRDGQPVLVAYLQRHPSEHVTAGDMAALQRACLQENASRALCCAPAPLTREAARQALLQPNVETVEKEQLISLFGQAMPATDGQLAALKRRRAAEMGRGRWRLAFVPEKAAGYMRYGFVMLGLYLFTGLAYYAVPGVCLMTLAAVSRCLPARGRHSKKA